MLKKIRSLVSSYDERFFAWLEGKSTSGSKRERTSRKDSDGRTQVSQRGMLNGATMSELCPWLEVAVESKS